MVVHKVKYFNGQPFFLFQFIVPLFQGHNPNVFRLIRRFGFRIYKRFSCSLFSCLNKPQCLLWRLQNPEWQVSGKSFRSSPGHPPRNLRIYFDQITCRDQLFIFFIFPIQTGIYFEDVFFQLSGEIFCNCKGMMVFVKKLRVDSNTV